MDALVVVGAAVCMVGMCFVGMWLMMRFGFHRDGDDR